MYSLYTSNKDFVSESSPMSPDKSHSWLYLYTYGHIVFPELLPIDIENPNQLSKLSISIPWSLKVANILIQQLFQSDHCNTQIAGRVGDTEENWNSNGVGVRSTAFLNN